MITLAGHARLLRPFIGCARLVRISAWVAVGTLWSLAASSAAYAAPVPWNDRTVSYVSERRPLKQVLRDVLATQSFPVVISGDMRGEVTGQFNEPADRVFAKLAAAYGVVWFFDGSVLYLSPNTDMRTDVVELGALAPEQVEKTLARLGLLEDRFPVRVSGGGALVSGPSRYVDLVVKALRAEAQVVLNSAERQSSGHTQPVSAGKRVRVFQLRHAQAADSVREMDGRRETVAGVATLLRRLGESGEVPRLDEPQQPSEQTFDVLYPIPLPGILGRGQAERSDASPSASASAQVLVEADVRTNSVIVHASQELLDYYGEVIERLDQPRQMVQIDVTIMSIASSAMRDLGAALGVQHPRFAIQTGTAIEQTAGLLFQGLVGTATTNISLRVAALERSGKARILSRPKLLTLENVPAVLESRSTAYVRVAGAYQTDLYPVRAGLQVRMTPRVVSRNDESAEIHLTLDIVDGTLQNTIQVDGIPVAKEVAIATQAVVGNGQTLLIGGHQHENAGNDTQGVPGLSRLPGIGGLFRRRRSSHELTEQLFLITPRLVSAAMAGETPASMDAFPESHVARPIQPGFGGNQPLQIDDLQGAGRLDVIHDPIQNRERIP